MGNIKCGGWDRPGFVVASPWISRYYKLCAEPEERYFFFKLGFLLS